MLEVNNIAEAWGGRTEPPVSRALARWAATSNVEGESGTEKRPRGP